MSDRPVSESGMARMLRQMGAVTPFDQYGMVATTVGGATYIGYANYRAYNATKATMYPMNSQQRAYHADMAMANEDQLRNLKKFSENVKKRGLIGGLAAPLLFTAFVMFKNRTKEAVDEKVGGER
jgi:hypothetical protein